MRVIACMMVVFVHACEFYYVGGSGISIASEEDAAWVCAIDSAFRCAVPLFVMISAYLLLPVEGGTLAFFKRRLTRVVVPFIIWSVFYATLPYLWGDMASGDVGAALLRLTYNFNDASGHLWFVYMLIGLYLFMPMISPWLERCSRRAEEGYLWIWAVSLWLPFLHEWLGDVVGEAFWNEFNTLWYFSGYLGYAVLGHYLRKYWHPQRRTAILGGALMFVIGYGFTAAIWYGRAFTAATLVELEISWRFCTPGVALCGLGVFLVVREVFESRQTEPRAVSDISKLSYGIYLMHIFILTAIYRVLSPQLPTGWAIISIAASTFVLCCVVAKVLSLLPGGEWLAGYSSRSRRLAGARG